MTREIHDLVLNADLHLWGWEVAVYLFLGGLAAGLLVFTACAQLTGRRRQFYPAVRVATLLAPPAIVVGFVLLWLDLGSKWRPFWLYLTLRPASPMSWGAWILVAALVTSTLSALVVVRLPALARLARGVARRQRALAWTNLVLGVAVGIYTGVLLGTMVARPALNSPVLGPLFLLSGLSAAAATIVLATAPGPWAAFLARAEVVIHACKLLFIGLYLAGLATSTAAAQAAATALTSGVWAWPFWSLVVLAGAAVPLAVAVADVATHRVTRKIALASSVLVLIGGLALRLVLVYAGQQGL